MYPINKVDFEFHNNFGTIIEGHMQFYIDYAKKMYYPLEVRIGSDPYNGKYMSVKSARFLGGDEYSYFVEFDDNGLFKKGYTYFSHKSGTITDDQNYFKSALKKEINRLNVIHATTLKLMPC